MTEVSRSGGHRSKYSPGTVYAIPLGPEQFVAARRHHDALAVLSRVFSRQPNIADVVDCRVAFFGHCVSTAIKSGRWKVIGKWPNDSEDFLQDPMTYSEDVLSPGSFRLVGRRDLIKTTPLGIVGLDPFVMDSLPEHFEERIRRKIQDGLFERIL